MHVLDCVHEFSNVHDRGKQYTILTYNLNLQLDFITFKEYRVQIIVVTSEI